MRRLGLIACLFWAACAPSVRFADREILWRWPDDKPIPMPHKRDMCFMWQDARAGIFEPADRVLALDYLREARNVNALDEVPDSSWFVDRRRVPGDARPRPLGDDELRWGAVAPDELPVMPLTVVKGKDVGITPGFVALDARKQKYMIKLDPPGHRGMTTSTEVVVTRLGWAAGWRVPSIVVLDVRPEDFRVAPTATAHDAHEQPIPFTDEMLRAILARTPRASDGTVRILASHWLPGVSIGPFHFLGRPRDDPNDTIDHEDRRDLRGFGVFASWVNDIDAFDSNTLDMYEGKPGRGHVVHYQQDLGGSFGNWGGLPAPYWSGSETFLEAHLLLRSLFTLGLWPRDFDDWRYRKWKEKLSDDYPEIGTFEAQRFDPRHWRTMLENAAFARQTARDRYWGAKRVAAFSDAELRAAIAAGRYRPAAAERVLQVLGRRRDRIARAFFADVAPLDHFRIEGDRLCFDDLWLDAGLGGAVAYLANGSLIGRCVVVPAGDGYRIVSLRAQRAGERHPGPVVRVHLVVDGGRRRIVGVER